MLKLFSSQISLLIICYLINSNTNTSLFSLAQNKMNSFTAGPNIRGYCTISYSVVSLTLVLLLCHQSFCMSSNIYDERITLGNYDGCQEDDTCGYLIPAVYAESDTNTAVGAPTVTLLVQQNQENDNNLTLVETIGFQEEEKEEDVIQPNILEEQDLYFEGDIEALSSKSWKQDFLKIINNERRRVGAKPLCLNKKLDSAAKLHNSDMIRNNFFSHSGSNGSKLSTRVNRFKYKWRRLAENVAINTSMLGAHKAFMNSSGHRKNLLSKQLTQIGLARGVQTRGKYKGRQYYTQVFALSNTEACNRRYNTEATCSDSPHDWHDSGSPIFDCDWYAAKNNCEMFGNSHPYLGKTANEACCVCGGGSNT